LNSRSDESGRAKKSSAKTIASDSGSEFRWCSSGTISLGWRTEVRYPIRKHLTVYRDVHSFCAHVRERKWITLSICEFVQVSHVFSSLGECFVLNQSKMNTSVPIFPAISQNPATQTLIAYSPHVNQKYVKKLVIESVCCAPEYYPKSNQSRPSLSTLNHET
jgi:hypothetical protein